MSDENVKRLCHRGIVVASCLVGLGVVALMVTTALWATGDHSGLVEWGMWWSGSIATVSASSIPFLGIGMS